MALTDPHAPTPDDLPAVVRAVARRFRFRDESEREDAVSAALEELCRHLRGGKPLGEVVRLAPSRAYWQCFLALRRRGRAERLGAPAADLSRAAARPEPADLRLDVAEALDALDPDVRDVVFLVMAGHGREGIARRLGVTEACVRSRLAGARPVLRRLLADYGKHGKVAPGRGPARSYLGEGITTTE